MSKPDQFRYFKTRRRIVRSAVMLYIRVPLGRSGHSCLDGARGIVPGA